MVDHRLLQRRTRRAASGWWWRWLSALTAVLTGLMLLPVLPVLAAGPAVLAVTVTITDPATGAPVSRVDASSMPYYAITIAYSCSVADCENVSAKVDPTPLDPAYDAYRKETAYTFSPPFTPAPVVTGSLSDGFTVPLGTVAAGTSGSLGFSYRINSRASGPQPGSFFVDGSPIVPKVTLTGDNATGPVLGTADATWVSSVPAKPTLTLDTPTSARTDAPVTVTVGGDSRCLSFNGAGILIGAPWITCAASYQIPVKLPSNAEYVAGSGGSYDSVSHTVTLSQSGADAAGGVSYNQRTFQVTFPSETYPTSGDGCIAAETFTATETMTYLDGTTRTADPATRTIQAQNCIPFAKGTMSKRVGRADSGGTPTEPILKIPTTPGGTRTGFYWQLIAGNQSNVAGVATITDTELDQADLPVTSARVVSGGPATLDYTLDNNDTGSVTLADNDTFNVPAGRRITAITATSAPLAGPNQQPTGNLATNFRVDLYFTLSYGATPGPRTNTASATISYPDDTGLEALPLGPETVNPTLVVPTDVTLVAGGPGATTAGGTPIVGSTVTWSMRGRFTNAADGAGYVPQYVFLAPKAWTVTPGTATLAGVPDATYDYRQVTYDGESRDAVVVTWPGPVTGVGDFTLPTLSVQTVPTSAAPAGTNNQIANLLVRTTDGSPITTYYPAAYTDATDLDDNGDSSDVYAVESGRASLAPSSGIGVTKEICRPDDTAADGCDWIADSSVLVGVPPNATSIKYRVTITNAGNSTLTDIVAYDVLPYPGDTGLTDGTAETSRGSTVTEVLSGVADVSSGLALAYSASTNPDRPQVYGGATDPDDWGSEATSARAIRASAETLPANSSVSFVYQAALVDAAAGALACNSVAAIATGLAVIQPPAVCATTQEADLSTTAADRYPLQRGRPGVLPFLVSNGGPSPSASATVTLSVPSGVTVADLDISDWSCTAPSMSGPVDISCEPVDGDGIARPLENDGPETIGLPVEPADDAPDQLCFTSVIDGVMYDPDLANNTAEICSAVRAADQPLLTVTKTDGVRTVPVGSTTTYTITVANHLSGEAVEGIALTDMLPAGAEFVSASDDGTFSDGAVTWATFALEPEQKPSGDGRSTVGNSAAARSFTVTVRVPPGDSGDLDNTASVSAPDPAGGAELTDEAHDINTVTNVWIDGDVSVSTPQNTGVTTELSAIVTTTGAPVDPASVTSDTDPQHGMIAVDPATGAVTYTPDAGYTGPDGYAVQVCDTSSPAQCHVAAVEVTVLANTVAANDDVAATAAVTAVRTDVLVNDVSASGQPLAEPVVTGDPAHGTAVVIDGGTISYVPAAGFSGVDSYTYRVCDTSVPEAVCDSATVTVTVTNVWIDGDASVSTPQNTAVITELGAIVTTSGAPVDPATVTTETAPEHGSIAIDPETGAVTYAPDAGYTGPDSYAVQVCDTTAPEPQCHVATVEVTVLPNEVAAADRTVSTRVNTAGAPIDVLGEASSASGQPLGNPTIAAEPEHGTAVVNGDGTITYTPDDLYDGSDEFSYTLCDTGDPIQVCDTATVSVTVTPVANLATQKKLDTPVVVAGLPLTYTTTLTNNGPSTATDVRSIDPIHSSVRDARGQPDSDVPGGSCETRESTEADLAGLSPDFGPYDLADYPLVVVCSYPSVPAGASVHEKITGSVDASAVPESALVNQVVAVSDTYDPDLADNLGTATGTVTASADLSLTKSADRATARLGEQVTFTVTVANHGPSVAEDVLVKDEPAGLTLVSGNASHGVFAGDAGVWTIGTLAVGQSITLTVTDKVTDLDAQNVAIVSGSTPDPDPGNNGGDECTAGTDGCGVVRLVVSPATDDPADGPPSAGPTDDPPSGRGAGPGSAELSRTGFAAAGMTGLALMLLVAGAIAVAFGRRRRA